MTSPITNDFDPEGPRPRAPVQRVMLHAPETEWTYSHHPSLMFFRGRFYAMWSSGRRDEDAPGQRVLITTAERFDDWAPPAPLVGPLRGKHSELVLTAGGFHEHAGTLVAYFGQYEYTPEAIDDNGERKLDGDRGHQDTLLRAMTTEDGDAWSDPRSMGVRIVPNHPPQPTTSGRLILSGNISFPYSDVPTGLSGWTETGVYPPAMADGIVDDSESFWEVQRQAGWDVPVCEGSFYQTDDGVLHMLLRTNTERLAVTESTDDGTTWSPPVLTEFTDNATKFHFGRLPDGRFYYVGCPDPEPRWTRCPLVLSLSKDGVRFDTHYVLADEDYQKRREGRAKGGNYGYPHTMLHEGHLYVIVSRRKEAVEVLRTPLDAL